MEDTSTAILQEEVQGEKLQEAFVEAVMSSSDEEVVVWGGSRRGRALNKDWDFTAAYSKLVADYFNCRDSPVQ